LKGDSDEYEILPLDGIGDCGFILPGMSDFAGCPGQSETVGKINRFCY
jgi:hypothetical protein